MTSGFLPFEPFEAHIDVNAARAFELRLGIRTPYGAEMRLAHWRRVGYEGLYEGEKLRTYRVRIPSLAEQERLIVSLQLIGDEEDGLFDVKMGLTQRGTLLPGSELHLRERAFARLADYQVQYEAPYDRIEMNGPWETLVKVDEGSWRAGMLEKLLYSVDPTSTFHIIGHESLGEADSPPGRSGPGGPPDGPEGVFAPPTPGEPDPEPAPPTERRINVWMAERESSPATPLVRGECYTLCVNVGRPVSASLAVGPDAEVRDADIPADGLGTDWVIRSQGAELAPLSPEVRVTRHEEEGAPWWVARFDLHIPPAGESAAIRIACTPLTADPALEIAVEARDPLHPSRTEPYRVLEIQLRATDTGTSDQLEAPALLVSRDVTQSPAGHLGLCPPHEWTTPRDVLSVTVLGPGSALARGDVGVLSIDQETGWDAVLATVSGLIQNVREALERFRDVHWAYLDAIGFEELDRRLRGMDAGPDYFGAGEQPSAEALARWEIVSRSAELRELAAEGRTLYDAFFPVGSELRGWLDQMETGGRLDVSCQARAGTAHVPHVPWGLMFRGNLPARGAPVDPMGFLGLALRLGYNAHRVPVPSKALGRAEDVHRAFFFYWGDQPHDLTAREARWQRDRWGVSPRHVMVPDPADASPPKERLLTLLEAPAPAPTSLLYLYCQCNAGPGNAPVLRFGNNAQPENVLRLVELNAAALADRPLVFANACTTSAADPFMANQLEMSFFLRGVRAYMGTEGKVPIELASRFAAVFFHYFDRNASAEPMAAGEAVHQARRFLWRHFRNVGGLFYTYINQFELYMADDAEVRSLHS